MSVMLNIKKSEHFHEFKDFVLRSTGMGLKKWKENTHKKLQKETAEFFLYGLWMKDSDFKGTLQQWKVEFIKVMV